MTNIRNSFRAIVVAHFYLKFDSATTQQYDDESATIRWREYTLFKINIDKKTSSHFCPLYRILVNFQICILRHFYYFACSNGIKSNVYVIVSVMKWIKIISYKNCSVMRCGSSSVLCTPSYSSTAWRCRIVTWTVTSVFWKYAVCISSFEEHL